VSLIHKLSTTNHHQNSHSATKNLPLTTSYGHVKKPNQKGTELTSQVKYGKEERTKWRNSSHTFKNTQLYNYKVFKKKKCNHIKDITRYETYCRKRKRLI
jgi:hypothetical protein